MIQEELQEINGSLYIMVSTLNQMINYIPYKFFEFKEVWNITTDDEKNKIWDDNFVKVQDAKIDKHIKFNSSDILKINEIEKRLKRELKANDTKKIFWNITGGQRPFVLAINNLIREDAIKNKIHYLCYLEGNTKEMQIMKFEDGELSDEVTNSYPYQIEGLTIDTVLKLMGYKPNAFPQNILAQPKEKKQLVEFYEKFYEAYRTNGALRELMPKFNSRDSGQDNFNDIIDNQFPIIDGLDNATIKKQWAQYDKRKAFGYILEEMLLYLLLKSIEENRLETHIAGLYSSVKIAADTYKDNTSVDEFDALVLTKSGQVISFEAKSGGMNSDVAKSTNYSAYAIAGVYGLPILITPQINKTDNISEKITDAIDAAGRANLEIWCLNEVEEHLKKKILK